MVRTVKSRQEVEEEDDEEFVSRASYGSSDKAKLDGETSDQKVNTLRSKHSETEQRRRSKINERFQILRDLIPQNDQKRDKASFLLEVIEYIQFLQEKLLVYEESYQGWSQEPSKLIPWRNNGGSIESLIDRSQLLKNGSGHEDNIVISPAMLSNAQNSFETDLSVVSAYKTTDQSPATASLNIPVNMPLQPNMFGDVPIQPHEGSVSDADHLTSQSQMQFWQCRPCSTNNAVPSYTLNEQVEQKTESGEASISDAYSQRLLNTLTHVMQSSGVDLSQASISVQLDIGKRRNSGLNAAIFNAKNSSSHAMAPYGVGIRAEDSDTVHKRFRREQS